MTNKLTPAQAVQEISNLIEDAERPHGWARRRHARMRFYDDVRDILSHTQDAPASEQKNRAGVGPSRDRTQFERGAGVISEGVVADESSARTATQAIEEIRRRIREIYPYTGWTGLHVGNKIEAILSRVQQPEPTQESVEDALEGKR